MTLSKNLLSLTVAAAIARRKKVLPILRSIYFSIMNKFQKGWYLIYTRPRHEKKVHTFLTGKSITTFLPLKKKVRIRNNRKKVVDEPLFSSYIFVFLNGIEEYYMGADAEGSLYYVREGREIARVSESVIDNIKIVSKHSDDIEISNMRFQPGQRTMITEGALTGLICEVVEVDNKKKLLVRVDLLQRNILLTISEKSLVPYIQSHV